MAHLPRHPAGTQTRGLADLPELAKHVVTIKRRTDGSGEYQAVILPEHTGQQAVLGLAGAMLTERPDS